MNRGVERPVPPMILAALSLPGEREPISWPVERLTAHFALCPGLERDDAGEWHYVPRWWMLCHLRIDQFGEPEARTLVAFEQELPPSDLLDRPALAVDPEQVRTFAAWLEQQHAWASNAAFIDPAGLRAETRDEIDRFRAAPNLWEVPARAAIDPRRLDHGGDT